MSKSRDVLVFSPPHKKEIRCSPSEYLLLKPFSKAPSLQIEITEPGLSKPTLLSVQNIDDTPSRLYFEIPAGKPLQIKPETIIIQPQSVELFEITAFEPKESFRATIKVFAPDIKFYRGGQVSVTVSVRQPVRPEKKKRPKPIAPNIKTKAVTVPKEFNFQPSREQRKNGPPTSKPKSEEIFKAPTVLAPINQTFNLEDIRRQTHLIKKAIDVNQTYLVMPNKSDSNLKDPVTFVKHVIEQDKQDVSCAIFKYLDTAKQHWIQLENASEYQRHVMNEILIGSQAALESGNISAIVEELSRIPTLPPPETDTVTEGSTPLRMPTIKALENTRKQLMQKSRRSSQRTTSSPKRESCDRLQTPEKLSGISNMTVQDMVSNFLPDTNVSHMGSMTVESPDVSAIFPLGGHGL